MSSSSQAEGGQILSSTIQAAIDSFEQSIVAQTVELAALRAANAQTEAKIAKARKLLTKLQDDQNEAEQTLDRLRSTKELGLSPRPAE